MQSSSKTYKNFNDENDFIVFVLSHENVGRLITIESLQRHGYSGKYYVVLDDSDSEIEQYKSRFGEDKILLFNKDEIADTFDEFGKHIGNRNTVVYARNACFKLAEQLGYTYFIELDDDYREFNFRFEDDGKLKVLAPTNMDEVFKALLDYYKSCPQMKSLCMAQNGDFVGGLDGSHFKRKFMRKAMNSFICSTERPFTFIGRINEDVNTYTLLGSRGDLFCTVMDVNINQLETQQKNAKNGMTSVYADEGTYVKSFYSVMCCPSFVKIGILGNNHARIHHSIEWRYGMPNIISSRYKK